MTPRTSVALKQQRPLSAIFIGSLDSASSSTPPDLPRLPEPPASPGGSSNASGSGLPSPPATNSTGSGSVGDDGAHVASGRRRSSTQRPHTVAADMYDAFQNDVTRSSSTSSKNKPLSHARSQSVASSSLTDDDEDDAHEDNDDNDDNDVTARFDTLSRRKSSRVTSPPKTEDHSSALQRVKSLTERNRMVRLLSLSFVVPTCRSWWWFIVLSFRTTIIYATGNVPFVRTPSR